MQIASITPARHAEFLALVNAEIRPDRAKTNAWDDFPLILAAENAAWTLAATAPDGRLAAGLACLVRQFTTSCGSIPVAGVGSVVTAPEFRGRGLSTALQNALLTRLRGKNVPLAVLWTDQPEIYAGRGFTEAGWEMHIDLDGARLEPALPPGFTARPYRGADAAAVQGLYDRHLMRTLRHPGDSEKLYGMTGTRGLVATAEDDVPLAAVFCGKGADFPAYVTEWSGPLGLVFGLLAAARQAGWIRYVLAPAGCEEMVRQLVKRGASAAAQASGFWCVVQPDGLSSYLQAAGVGAPSDLAVASAVLGSVGSKGEILPGPVTAGVWGFDSV